jgi:hypothetical protein
MLELMLFGIDDDVRVDVGVRVDVLQLLVLCCVGVVVDVLLLMCCCWCVVVDVLLLMCCCWCVVDVVVDVGVRVDVGVVSVVLQLML